MLRLIGRKHPQNKVGNHCFVFSPHISRIALRGRKIVSGKARRHMRRRPAVTRRHGWPWGSPVGFRLYAYTRFMPSSAPFPEILQDLRLTLIDYDMHFSIPASRMASSEYSAATTGRARPVVASLEKAPAAVPLGTGRGAVLTQCRRPAGFNKSFHRCHP